MFDPNKSPSSLAEMAHRSFTAHANQRFLGAKVAGAYQYAAYAEVAAQVRQIACGLMGMGLQRGERAAILAESRPEWAVADLACQMLGVISVPLFSTLPPAQVSTILQDCGAALVFVSNQSQLKKIEAIRDALPSLRHVVIMDAAVGGEGSTSGEAVLFSDVATRGEAYHEGNPGAYESTWPAADTNDVATIIYTSGTTGEPKGAMLTHRNIISNLEAIRDVLPLSSDDVFLSFLPLAHVYERTAGFYLPLRVGASIAYCESLFTIDKNLREVQPTIMFCVPRLNESMREKLRGAGDSLPPDQRAKYEEALALAQKAGAAHGKLPDAPRLGFTEQIKYKVYDTMAYSKIREKFGGRLRAFVSGGAPMQPAVGALFLGLGIEILEGYGLTETSPVIAVNHPRRVRLGTVGEVIGSVEVKIADDGEILVRGDSVMKGYWQKPQQTAEVIDAEGWFHTGDLGSLEDGCLKITGRKKELLVLANGKKVAPAPIEMMLMESPLIAQAVLLGDKQKAVSALIVPRLDAVREYAAQEDLGITDVDELLKAPAINKLFRTEIDSLSKDLADFEKIRKFVLLPDAFSVENGELTPTLKMKRNVIVQKYGNLLGADE